MLRVAAILIALGAAQIAALGCSSSSGNETPSQSAPSAAQPDDSAEQAVRAATLAAKSTPPPETKAQPAVPLTECIAKLTALAKQGCGCRKRRCARPLLARYNAIYAQLKAGAQATPPTAKQSKQVEKQSKKLTHCLMRAGIPSKELVTVFRQNAFD